MAERFGIGYAPKGWDNLARHLRSLGYTEAELTDSGLCTPGKRGVYDRFRGRLIWLSAILPGSPWALGPANSMTMMKAPNT